DQLLLFEERLELAELRFGGADEPAGLRVPLLGLLQRRERVAAVDLCRRRAELILRRRELAFGDREQPIDRDAAEPLFEPDLLFEAVPSETEARARLGRLLRFEIVDVA